MNHAQLTPEVSNWLTACGWSPNRDIGDSAEELIRIRLKSAGQHGVTLIPTPQAVRVIRSYGGLRLVHPTDRGSAWIMNPTFGYDGDAAVIKELALELGTELFPVGYESLEYGIILVDEHGRFFVLHHTGGYYVGASDADAFSRFLIRTAPLDAEDFFV